LVHLRGQGVHSQLNSEISGLRQYFIDNTVRHGTPPEIMRIDARGQVIAAKHAT